MDGVCGVDEDLVSVDGRADVDLDVTSQTRNVAEQDWIGCGRPRAG